MQRLSTVLWYCSTSKCRNIEPKSTFLRMQHALQLLWNIINRSKFLTSIVPARLDVKTSKCTGEVFNQFKIINQIAHYIQNVRANHGIMFHRMRSLAMKRWSMSLTSIEVYDDTLLKNSYLTFRVKNIDSLYRRKKSKHCFIFVTINNVWIM